MPKNSEKTPKLKGLEEIRFEMVKKRHKQTLLKAILDKKVDEELIPFLLAMAEKQLYFTSSSCAGRIILLGFQGEEKKGNSFFHRKWHRQITFPELMEGILAFNSGSLWFKQESFILHIGCANLKDAEKILELMHSAGVKRGGIIVTKKGKFMIELLGTNSISFPIKLEKELLVQEDYLQKVLEIANKKMSQNLEHREKFQALCLKELK